MPTRVLIGPAGSGKTTECRRALRARERGGQPALWIVPEQFTYTADRLLLSDDDLPGLRHVRVVSFRRLMHIASPAPDTPLLSEEGQRLLLRRIVQAASTEALGPLGPVRQTPGFVEALAAIVREVKGLAGREAAGRLAAGAAQDPKAAALARLVRAYDQALQDGALRDPGEWAEDVAERIRTTPTRWRAWQVWVDGFMSFTPPERQLLAALAAVAGGLTVTLCADPGDARRGLHLARERIPHGIDIHNPAFQEELRHAVTRPVFLPTLRTLLWMETALPGGVRIAALPTGPGRFTGAPALQRIAADLFGPPGAAAPQEVPAHVTRERFPTPYHEVLGWARRIDALTRLADRPLRYRDIAVLVRDLEAYRPLVREVFDHYRIPVFIDERRDATAHPLVRIALSALRLAAGGWTRETLISLLRNPLLDLSPDTLDRIENLSREYGIEFERWHETDWRVLALPTRTRESAAAAEETFAGPEADAADDDAGELEPDDEASVDPSAGGPSTVALRQARRSLAAAAARVLAPRFFPALQAWSRTWEGPTPSFGDAARALRTLVASLLAAARGAPAFGVAPEALPPAAAMLPDTLATSWTPAESEQVRQRLEGALQTGEALMGEVATNAPLFQRLLKDALGAATLSQTPQALDAVTVAEPRRSRVNEVRCVILGGLTAEAFPRTHASDPLLGDAERAQLAARGLPVAAGSAARAEEEPYLFYIACTRARCRLHLTHPALGSDGRPVEPSAFLHEIGTLLALPPPAPGVLEVTDPLAACQHSWELAAQLTAALRAAPDEAETLVAEAPRQLAPEAMPLVARAVAQQAKLAGELPAVLDPELTATLYPQRRLRTSASRLESFGRCPFLHFARHVLRLEPRPEAILTPLSTGSALHTALQRFFAHRRALRDGTQAAAEGRRLFAALAHEEEFHIFQQDPPSAYRWQVAGRDLGRFLHSEWERLGMSSYHPVAVELPFGLGPPEAATPRELREAWARGEQPPTVGLPALELPLAEEDSDGRPLDTPPVGRVALRGRIDRLDLARGADGLWRAVLIDYKSRRPPRAIGGELARGLDLQIAVYLLAVQELLGIEPVAGFYYAVAPQARVAGTASPPANPYGFRLQGFLVGEQRRAIDREGAFTSARGRDTQAGGLGTVLATARQRIGVHAHRILTGWIRPEPRGHGARRPCEFCEFREICRYDPAADPGAPPVPGGTTR